MIVPLSSPVEALIALPPPAIKVVILECPPASVSFDDELPAGTRDEDGAIVK